jgi:hypothetical protein
LIINLILLGFMFVFVCFSLSMKEGSLFCFVLFCSYEVHWIGMLQIVFLVSLESSGQGWMHGLGSMTFGLEVQKFLNYWMTSSLKIKLNCSWKFWRNWNVNLMLLESSWWAGFNGIYLVRFGFRLWWAYRFLSDFCHWKFK